MSRRPSRPSHKRIAVTEAARKLLREDYPELVKQRVFLAAKGALTGSRHCVLCGKNGHATRVHLPPEALRPIDPDLAGVRVYWLCLPHSQIDPEDPQLVQALAAKRSKNP